MDKSCFLRSLTDKKLSYDYRTNLDKQMRLDKSTDSGGSF